MWKQAAITLLCSLVLAYILPLFFQKKLPPIVEGFFVRECMPVAEALRGNMESGVEKGSAFSVVYKGEVLVDMWAGYSDIEAERRWRNETLTMLFSVTKGLAAVVVAMMVERGFLDYARPVADYWPEFGVNSKENITVEMLLSHRAGLPVLNESISLWDLKSRPEWVERFLAEQSTIWPAGSRFGYHGVTFGLYVDRLVQKVDPQSRDIAQIFQQEIAGPFGLDLYMTSPRDQFYRMTRVVPLSAWRKALNSLTDTNYIFILFHYIFNPDCLIKRSVEALREFATPAVINNNEYREITLSSIGGAGTARGLAHFYNILANGGQYQGKQLLQSETVEKLSRVISSGTDRVVMMDQMFGRGTAMRRNPRGELMFGHAGSGGQAAYADPTNNLGIAYLTNFMSLYGIGNDPRFLQLERETYKCLDRYLDRKSRTHHS